MRVEELMTTDVVTVPRDASLADAVERQLTNRVGSVIVVDQDGSPSGIITETDALRAALKSGTSLDEILVEQLSHSPVITTRPNSSVQKAARRMADNDIKKVPVVDDMDIVGIVTFSDIVWHLSDIRREASAVEAAQEKWSEEET